MSPNTPETAPPKWVQKLQESSWELEFLISGGAIFSLIQASDFFSAVIQSLKITAWLPGTDLFLLLGVLGIQVLTLGFGTHLLLRAFWVALVCVTYLYPQGARPERIRWRRPFKAAPPTSADFYALLLKLNRVCATVMFLAIASTLLLAGLMIIVGVMASLPSIFLGIVWSPLYDWYLVTLCLFLLLYVFDLVLFGALRRTPGLVWLVFPAFWFFDRLSLRIVLQPALWLFASHVSKPRMVGLLTLFMGLALSYSYAVIYQDLHLPNAFDRRLYRNQMAPGPMLMRGSYRDEAEGQQLWGASLPSKFIDKPFLEVFVLYRKEYDLDMRGVPSAKYLSDLAIIAIDDSVYQHIDWYPTRGRLNDRMGLTAIIPIQQLKQGAHRLLINSRSDTSRQQVILFWKI